MTIKLTVCYFVGQSNLLFTLLICANCFRQTLETCCQEHKRVKRNTEKDDYIEVSIGLIRLGTNPPLALNGVSRVLFVVRKQ